MPAKIEVAGVRALECRICVELAAGGEILSEKVRSCSREVRGADMVLRYGPAAH